MAARNLDSSPGFARPFSSCLSSHQHDLFFKFNDYRQFVNGFECTIIENLGQCVPGLVVAEKIRKVKIISVDWI